MSRKIIVLAGLFLALALASCGGGGSPAGVKNGEAFFDQLLIDKGPGCNTCHSLKPNQVLVGPSLAGVATRAEKRIPNVSAEDYLRQSILEPDSYLVAGFGPGVMPKTYSSELTPEQLANLIAYLMTLK